MDTLHLEARKQQAGPTQSWADRAALAGIGKTRMRKQGGQVGAEAAGRVGPVLEHRRVETAEERRRRELAIGLNETGPGPTMVGHGRGREKIALDKVLEDGASGGGAPGRRRQRGLFGGNSGKGGWALFLTEGMGTFGMGVRTGKPWRCGAGVTGRRGVEMLCHRSGSAEGWIRHLRPVTPITPPVSFTKSSVTLSRALSTSNTNEASQPHAAPAIRTPLQTRAGWPVVSPMGNRNNTSAGRIGARRAQESARRRWKWARQWVFRWPAVGGRGARQL
jgi:hypothetical protein